MNTTTYTVSYLIFLIFAGTAVLSTLALFTRQSLLIAYIALGAILGPYGLKLISNSVVIHQAGNVGIIFLLFLLGLDLQPQSLFHSLRKMSLITFSSAIIFFITGFVISFLFGFSAAKCIVIGAAMMFSSTIIGIKLLPTTILHHQHTGELVVSILLLQDVIAIAAILVLQVMASSTTAPGVTGIISAFPILVIVAYVFQRYILSWLLARFDKIHEYIFILSIGWCLCLAELGHALGLSEEIGAFIAGVALASNPIACYIADSLKPLRDFFLVIFFFSIGASFDFNYFPQVILPACALALSILILKPVIFNWLLRRSGEVKKISWEVGSRLGQLSEFSILIIYMALEANIIHPFTANMIEAAVIITFIVSCYWIVMRYPTPLASSDKLRRD